MLSRRLAKCVRDCQIFVTHGDHLAPDSSGLFVLFLNSFPPAFNTHAFNTHAITSPKLVGFNPFVSNGDAQATLAHPQFLALGLALAEFLF